MSDIEKEMVVLLSTQASCLPVAAAAADINYIGHIYYSIKVKMILIFQSDLLLLLEVL